MNKFLLNIYWENLWSFDHLIVLIAITILLLFWEIRKKGRRLPLRVLAVILTIASLYLIYLKPYILEEKPKSSAVLISHALPQNFQDSLFSKYNIPVLKQDSNYKFTYFGTENATSFSLEELDFQIDTAFLYGYFPQLNPRYYNKRIDHNLKGGLTIDYPKSIDLGDSLKIVIKNNYDQEISEKLIINQNTIPFKVAKKSQVEISTLPKVSADNFIKISDKNYDYNFSVEVKKPELYRIQILSAAPDFEWKFLTNYLKTEGHSVYQKTKISKDKYIIKRINWSDSISINRGVVSNLKVLLVDAKSWNNLTKVQQGRFRDELTKNKGSLIFRSNENTNITLDLGMSKIANIFSTGENLLDQEYYKYLQIKMIKGFTKVGKNSLFRTVRPDIIYGIINFQNTFQLSLSGNNQVYDRIWKNVFQELVQNEKSIFYDKTAWPVLHHPFNFTVWSVNTFDRLAVINPSKDTIEMEKIKDEIYPERAHYMFYPARVGWHFIQLENPSKLIPFYVHDSKLTNASQFLNEYNNSYLNYLNFESLEQKQSNYKFQKHFITIWIFILFVIGVGYLWMEDKIT